MNMKRINEVPVIEELGENSYVLVNNNGEAAQISGSKVGGGGGELLFPVFYVDGGSDPASGDDVNYVNGRVYSDYDCTQGVTFAEGLERLKKGCWVCMRYTEDEFDHGQYVAPVFSIDENYKTLNAAFAYGGMRYVVAMVFSDGEIPA